jgi:hypothetical protein
VGLLLVNFAPNAPIGAGEGQVWRSGAYAFSTWITHPTAFLPGRNGTGHFRPATNAGLVVPNATRTGYLGFRIGQVGEYGVVGPFQYGWLHIRVGADGDGRPKTISLVADGNNYVGAYAGVGQGIVAGSFTAIPEPASVATGLALFALGAAGVREHRRRKQAAA